MYASFQKLLAKAFNSFVNFFIYETSFEDNNICNNDIIKSSGRQKRAEQGSSLF